MTRNLYFDRAYFNDLLKGPDFQSPPGPRIVLSTNQQRKNNVTFYSEGPARILTKEFSKHDSLSRGSPIAHPRANAIPL